VADDGDGEGSTATEIKAKARALGADLVGIADGATLERYPPDPRDPRRPSDITDLDAGRVIVLAKRISRGSVRIAAWNDRHKYYNDELALSRLEEASLELVYWLEDNGYPAIIVPPTHVDPWRYDGDPNRHMTTLLSLPHAAVEAGLGTLGLQHFNGLIEDWYTQELATITPSSSWTVSLDFRSSTSNATSRSRAGWATRLRVAMLRISSRIY
jgi:hypothetical protein